MQLSNHNQELVTIQSGIEKIIEEIRDDADKYFDWSGKPEVKIVEYRKVLYSTICIVEMRFQGQSRRLYIKQPDVNKNNFQNVQNRLNNEFTVLQFLRERFNSYEGLAVVRPLLVAQEEHALVTEETKGETLQDVLGRNGKFFCSSRKLAALTNYCFKCGRWLSLFHGFTRKPDLHVQFDQLIEYCVTRLQLLERQPSSRIDSTLTKAVQDFLGREMSALSHEHMNVAGCHYDFAPHNIIVDEFNVTVLDLNMFDYDSVYYDLCCFWQKLESMTHHPIYRRSMIQELQRAFLSGYGEDISVDSPLFQIALVRFRLAKMLDVSQTQGHGLVRFFNRKVYEGYRTWLINLVKY